MRTKGEINLRETGSAPFLARCSSFTGRRERKYMEGDSINGEGALKGSSDKGNKMIV